MKKNKIIFFVLIIIFFSMPSIAAKQSDNTNTLIRKKIAKIIRHLNENLNIGILVQDVNTGKILYQKNANRYFMPASNEKLFTGFAALQYLGPNFTYQTRLFADISKITDGILKDNVYLQFSGDPTLTVAKIDHLINFLSQKGIHRIDGKIIIDDTLFDQNIASPGTSWDDNYYYFGAPVSALIINHNTAKATIKPSERPDQPAHIIIPNEPQSMYFINHVITRAPTVSDCKLSVTPTNETTYQISGCIKTTDSSQDIIMAVHNPRANAQTILTHLLKKNHIIYTHPIEFQKMDPTSKLLANELSPPLSSLTREMLKESDNLIANSLFKTMGSIYSHQQGTWQNGSDALHSILNNALKQTLPKNILFDGAGASRYNYITAQQIVGLLQKAYLSRHAATFITALPISGIDGTLKYRINSPETRGKIHAKTGTMTAVSALSGYLETKKKHTLVFSILINGFIDSPLKYQALEDQICTALIY